MPKFDKELAELIKLSGSVAVEALASQIVAFIRDNILADKQPVPSGQPAPNQVDASLVRHIGVIIEAAVVQKKREKKVDKKEMLIRVYETLMGVLTPAMKTELGRLVDELHAAKAFRPVSLWRRIRKAISHKVQSFLC